jgi:hypothetical protein
MAAVLVTALDIEHLSATICAELAAGLATAAEIRSKYQISQSQWDRLKKSPAFRSMLAEAVGEWKGDLNAGKRITKKAEIMLEDSLPVLYEVAHDKESPRQQRLDAIKAMGVFAGKTNSRGEGAGNVSGISHGAVINITIETKDGQRGGVTIDATSSSMPTLPAPEGELASD